MLTKLSKMIFYQNVDKTHVEDFCTPYIYIPFVKFRIA